MKKSKIFLSLLLFGLLRSNANGMIERVCHNPTESGSDLTLLTIPDEALWEIFFQTIVDYSPASSPRKFLKAVKALLLMRQVNTKFRNFLSDDEILRILQKTKVEFNQLRFLNGQQHSILHEALASPNGSFGVIEVLLNPRSKIEVNVKDIWGQTPLHVAVHYNHSKCIEMLCNAGANVDARDHNGQTPIESAVLGGSVNCIRKLLDLGADVKKCSMSPILQALGEIEFAQDMHKESRQFQECVRLLVDHYLRTEIPISPDLKEKLRNLGIDVQVNK